MFLKEAEIISAEVNITFNDKIKEMWYDPEESPDELGINEDWKSRNQVMIN